MRSRLHIRLHREGVGAVRASGTLATPPFWCRWDGSTLWLVGSAATPVGRDDIELDLDVGPGVRAAVRSVAATIVYAGDGEGTRLRTRLRVRDGATLLWQPEPVIVTERARHHSDTSVALDHGATLLADDIVVFGRSGERAGAFSSTTELRVGGEPVSLTGFDTSLPGWSGPGGTDGAKVLASRVLVGEPDRRSDDPNCSVGQRHVVLRPELGGAIATVLCERADRARALLDDALRFSVG